MALGNSYRNESTIYAAYILKEKPEGKIGVLYQNDDFGKEMLNGLRAGLGSKSSMIVAEVSYEVTDPTIDSQIVKLCYSDAGIMFNILTQPFVDQGITKI